MTRRQSQRASRGRRRGDEGQFLYVLSFAEAVRRRRRPGRDPRPPQPAPTPPRPLGGPLTLTPAVTSAPARTRELEDA